MTPADLPCKDGYRWTQFAGEWWCHAADRSHEEHIAVLAAGRLVTWDWGCEPRTPAEVQSYYSARTHVPCPFVFEVP